MTLSHLHGVFWQVETPAEEKGSCATATMAAASSAAAPPTPSLICLVHVRTEGFKW